MLIPGEGLGIVADHEGGVEPRGGGAGHQVRDPPAPTPPLQVQVQVQVQVKVQEQVQVQQT